MTDNTNAVDIKSGHQNGTVTQFVMVRYGKITKVLFHNLIENTNTCKLLSLEAPISFTGYIYIDDPLIHQHKGGGGGGASGVVKT